MSTYQPIRLPKSPGVENRIIGRLEASLASGEWDAEHGHLREQADYLGALRLVISEPD